MATTRTFQDMLNEWLNYDLLKEEMIKRDYLLSKVARDDNWKGGTLPVPFKGAYASSVRFGALTAANDVSEDQYIRGEITTQPEVWGTMKFNHRDLMEHNGRVNEQSFLKLLPGAIDDFMTNMKAMISQHMLSGSHVVTLTGDGQAGGTCTVDRVERLAIGMKGQIDDNNSAAADIYITAINVNTDTITVSASRGGVALDISAYTVAQGAKIYFDGAQTTSMTSLKSSLLSATNGGTATLYTKTKTDYPYLQSINIDGSTITTTNIVTKLFDAFYTVKRKGRGNPTTCLMSWKWLAAIMAVVEGSKGAYKVAPNSYQASLYNWTSITIVGVQGALEVVGIYEMDDDFISILDWRALKFHSNNFFQKRTAPDGKQYYEVRETTGYYYLIDIGLFGDLVLSRPSYCGIIHSIP